MNLRSLIALLRTPHLRTRFLLAQDIESFARFHFLYAAIECGLLDVLRAPASQEELTRRLDVQRPELLAVLLRLGVALGELSEENGRYKVQGRRSKTLTAQDGDPYRALLQEYVSYHGSVYRHLPARLRGAPSGNYLETTGPLIARSSRVLEPFMEPFVKSVAGANKPLRLLEVGCGSGIYLRHAAESNPNLEGIAIDVREDVAVQAAANLSRWGISQRFSVLVADVRRLPADLTQAFDLITLYNNVYYFAPEERPTLFQAFRSWLAPGGAVAIVSMLQGDTVTALDLDLALRSTVGCTPLPALDDLTRQLRESDFSHIETTQLVPREPFWGIVAR